MASIKRVGKGWRARIRRKGYPPLSENFRTKDAAEQWAAETESKMNRGEAIASAEAQRTTLAEALDRYEREITSGKRGARQEKRRIAAWKAHDLALRTLTSLRGADFAAYRDARLLTVGANTVRLELAIISNLYKIARTEWGLEGVRSPIDAVRKPKPPPARERRLEAGEEGRLLDAADPILRQAVVLALETAMRRGELAGLRRADLNLPRRVARIQRGKNGEGRTVPLSTRAIAAIEALPARLDGYLFGPPAAFAEWLTHAFADLCKVCVIEGLRFHDLRREAISRLFELGWSTEQVRACSGHKTLQMLAVYSKLRAEDLADKLG